LWLAPNRGLFLCVVQIYSSTHFMVFCQPPAKEPSYPGSLISAFPCLPGHFPNSPIFLRALRRRVLRRNRRNRRTEPIVVIAVDEAHPLTARHLVDDTEWSPFNEWRHAVRGFHDQPLFVIFLATTGEITRFVSMTEDMSARIISGDLVLIPPFTDLGFDHLAKKVSVGDTSDLEVFAGDEHMVSLGRPLSVFVCISELTAHLSLRFAMRYEFGREDVKANIIQFAASKLLIAVCIGLAALHNYTKLVHKLRIEISQQPVGQLTSGLLVPHLF
jgi:hypothetical protein